MPQPVPRGCRSRGPADERQGLAIAGPRRAVGPGPCHAQPDPTPRTVRVLRPAQGRGPPAPTARRAPSLLSRPSEPPAEAGPADAETAAAAPVARFSWVAECRGGCAPHRNGAAAGAGGEADGAAGEADGAAGEADGAGGEGDGAGWEGEWLRGVGDWAGWAGASRRGLAAGDTVTL